jgi:ribosomal protein S18 acetylase RimI-like enzyme
MQIRVAQEKDIDTIYNLACEFEDYLDELTGTPEEEKTPKDSIRNVLLEGFSDPKHVVLIAEEDTKPIGFSDFWVYPEFIHGGQSAYLNNLFISEKFRRSGVGSALLKETIKKSLDKDAVALHISVLPENVIAQKFYRKNGIDWEIKMFEIKLK